MSTADDGSYPGAGGLVIVALALTGLLTGGAGSYLALAAAAMLTLRLVLQQQDKRPAHRRTSHRVGDSRSAPAHAEPLRAAQ